MSFVVPKFEVLFTSLGQELPWITRALITASLFLARFWWAVILGGVAGAASLLSAMRQKAVRLRLHRSLLTLPVFGPMFMKLEVARITRTLASLIDSSIRIIEALRITAETVKNDALRATFASIIRDVSGGASLAESFEKSGLYPKILINLIRTGERTGELPEMLGELSTIYEEEAERAVNGSVKLLEPMLIVIMGMIISGIVAAILLPIFRANALTT